MEFLFLVKLYVVGATLILLQFEILSGQSEGFQNHVAKFLQIIHHLGLHLLISLLDLGWKFPNRLVCSDIPRIQGQHCLIISQSFIYK